MISIKGKVSTRSMEAICEIAQTARPIGVEDGKAIESCILLNLSPTRSIVCHSDTLWLLPKHARRRENVSGLGCAVAPPPAAASNPA